MSLNDSPPPIPPTPSGYIDFDYFWYVINGLKKELSGVQSVTGLNTDNTDPVNPVIKISIGSGLSGSGTPGSPLIATGGGGGIVYPANQIVYGDGITPGGITDANFIRNVSTNSFFVGDASNNSITVDNSGGNAVYLQSSAGQAYLRGGSTFILAESTVAFMTGAPLIYLETSGTFNLIMSEAYNQIGFGIGQGGVYAGFTLSGTTAGGSQFLQGFDIDFSSSAEQYSAGNSTKIYERIDEILYAWYIYDNVYGQAGYVFQGVNAPTSSYNTGFVGSTVDFKGGIFTATTTNPNHGFFVYENDVFTETEQGFAYSVTEESYSVGNRSTRTLIGIRESPSDAAYILLSRNTYLYMDVGNNVISLTDGLALVPTGFSYYGPASSGGAGNDIGVSIDLSPSGQLLYFGDETAQDGFGYNIGVGGGVFMQSTTANICFVATSNIAFELNEPAYTASLGYNGSVFFNLDLANRIFAIGDVNGFYNGTVLSINDTAQSFTFAGGNGSSINWNAAQVFASDAAAGLGGLSTGDFYQTGLVGGISFLAVKQ